MDVAANFIAKHDKLVRLLGISVEVASPEYSRLVMPLTENHKNGMGHAHGGAIFSLADAAFGAAANSETDNGVVNLNSTIEYLRGGEVGPLVAESRLVRSGGHIKSYDTQVFDGNGTMIARMMTTGFMTHLSLSR